MTRLIEDSERKCVHVNIRQGIDAYLEMTKMIRLKLNWKTDKRIAMILASVYIVNQQDFQYGRFASLIEELHYSLDKSDQVPDDFKKFYAAAIDVSVENIEGNIPYYLDLYGVFTEEGFPTGVYTYLSSLIISEKNHVAHTLPIINDADAIYQSLKQKHRLLTNDKQYPLATMRAAENQLHREQDQAFFYQQLNKKRFSRGRNLLSLSQILTLYTEYDRETLVQRTDQFFSDFIEMKIDPRPSLYPLFGLLALLPEDTVQISLISEIYKQLNQEKLFKQHKDISALLSVIFFVDNKAFQPYLVEILIYSIFTQLEEDAANDFFSLRNFLPFQ